MVTSELEACSAELDAIQRSIVKVMADQCDDWRHALIALRRRLQEQIAKMASLPVRGGPLGDEYRRRLSEMRTALALHQAEWPAVRIDPADPAYRTSIMSLHAANQAFADAARRLAGAARAEPPATRGR